MTQPIRKPAIRRVRPATQPARAGTTTDLPVFDADVDESPTAVGPILAPDEMRALMDSAEKNAHTVPAAPAKAPMPPQPKSGLRTRVQPRAPALPHDEIAIDLGALQPAVEIEHLEADETHEIEIGDDP